MKRSDPFQRLSDAIGLIYDAAVDDAKWLAYMTHVAGLMDASHATFQLLDAREPRNDVALTMGFDPVIEADWRTRKRQEDFWLVGAQRNRGRIIVGTEVISARDMHRQPLYHEICKPLDVEHMMGVVVPLGPHEVVGWSFLRPPWLPDFGAAQKRMMAALLPHLCRAAAMRRELAAISDRATALESALHYSPTPTLLIDAEERVRFLNERALQLLRRDDAISIVGDRIRCWQAQAQARLRRAIRSCAPACAGYDSDPISIDVSARSGDHVLHCLVFPLRAAAVRLDVDARIVCSLMIYESGAPTRFSRNSVARTYRLTPAEAAIAVHIAEGRTPSQIAELQRVSINTVRTQLKAVFHKCGVGSQSQLVRLLVAAGHHVVHPGRTR